MAVPEPHTKPQPVQNVQRIMATASAVVAALGAATALADNEMVAWVTVAWGVVMAGYAVWQSFDLPAQTVPVQDAVTYLDRTGAAVAGPASPLPDGTPVDSQD